MVNNILKVRPTVRRQQLPRIRSTLRIPPSTPTRTPTPARRLCRILRWFLRPSQHRRTGLPKLTHRRPRLRPLMVRPPRTQTRARSAHGGRTATRTLEEGRSRRTRRLSSRTATLMPPSRPSRRSSSPRVSRRRRSRGTLRRARLSPRSADQNLARLWPRCDPRRVVSTTSSTPLADISCARPPVDCWLRASPSFSNMISPVLVIDMYCNECSSPLSSPAFSFRSLSLPLDPAHA